MKQNERYIPTFIDRFSNGATNNDGLYRFNYFYIESEESHPVRISQKNNSFSVYLIDMQGILMYRLGEGNHIFRTPQDITDLFDYINDKTDYVINVDYLWLPDTLIRKLDRSKINRWEVVRIHEKYFAQAIKNQHFLDNIDFEDIDSERLIFISEEESLAFRKWGQQTLDKIKTRYKEDQKNNLRNRKK